MRLFPDVSVAIRSLSHSLGFSLVVILTLALGIGANTAIFSLVNAVLLRKLAVRAPDELVVLGDPTRVNSMGFDSNPRADIYNYATYKRLAEEKGLLSGLAASGRTTVADSFHIDRGYPGFVETLRGLGVSIDRVELPDYDR